MRLLQLFAYVGLFPLSVFMSSSAGPKRSSPLRLLRVFLGPLFPISSLMLLQVQNSVALYLLFFVVGAVVNHHLHRGWLLANQAGGGLVCPQAATFPEAAFEHRPTMKYA